MPFSGIYHRLARVIARALLCVFAAILPLAPAQAQSTTAQGNASVNSQVAVVRPLTLLKTRDMNFGQVMGTVAGTVVMPATTNPTCTPSAGLVHTGVCRTARFLGAGQTGRILRVRKPPGNSVNLTGPGQTMRVTNFQIDGSPELLQLNNSNGFVRYRIVSLNGAFIFRVGGTLNVNANQTPGIYTGTFDITVDYQ